MIRLLFGCILLFIALIPAQAAKRVALVVGNSAYEHVAELANPKNDAEAISASLKRLDFEVIEGVNLTRAEFERKIRDFASAIIGADIAVLFYAGHGLQVNGRNYLAPVETQLLNEADLDFETISLNVILRQMEREERTNLVFLDACRNNPMARNLARSMGTRAAGVGRGLAPVETGIGTLISYATQPGNVALDGDGKNSPFTTSLVKHIETPGVDIGVLMRRVRQEVIKDTNGQQVPWDNSSLTGEVVLKARKNEDANLSSANDTVQKQLEELQKRLETAEKRLKEETNSSKTKVIATNKSQNIKEADSTGVSENKNSEPEIDGIGKIASLNPTDEKKILSDPEALTRAIQTELNRVGCDAGKIDGAWGRGSSEALRKFGEHGGVELTSLDPTAAVLSRLRDYSERVCPLSCRSGYFEKAGQCVTEAVKYDGGWNVIRSAVSKKNCGYKYKRAYVKIESGKVFGESGPDTYRGTISDSGTFKMSQYFNYKGRDVENVYRANIKGDKGTGTFRDKHGSCKGSLDIYRQ